MDKLLSDSAKTEISNKVMDIFRTSHLQLAFLPLPPESESS